MTHTCTFTDAELDRCRSTPIYSHTQSRKCSYTRARTHTHTHTRKHDRMHARAHTQMLDDRQATFSQIIQLRFHLMAQPLHHRRYLVSLRLRPHLRVSTPALTVCQILFCSHTPTPTSVSIHPHACVRKGPKKCLSLSTPFPPFHFPSPLPSHAHTRSQSQSNSREHDIIHASSHTTTGTSPPVK